MAKQLKKADLIKILVEEYGYEKEDLKFDAEGKPYTNAKLQAIIKAEEEDEKLAKSESTRIQTPKSSLKENDKIYIMSASTGTLVYHSERTGKRWQFSAFGEQDTMEYHELIAMRNRHPRFLTEGRIIVLDKQVQEEFKLEDMYKNIITPENVEDIFSMEVEELDKFIDALPEGQKVTFVNMAQDKFEKRELRDYLVIEFIEKKFNFSFNDNAPLDDVIDAREKVGLAHIIVVDRK